MIAVILPSRGLIFSRTADEILQNLRSIPHKIYFSHGRPIPECFEVPTLQALDNRAVTHLWFVEDDMVLPSDTLSRLLEADVDVATMDYPVTKEGKGAVFADASGRVIYTGTGCILIKREVFDRLEAPYFRSDIRWTPLNYGKTVKLVGSMFAGDGYGLHDLTFGIKLWKAGIPIEVFGRVGQRKLIALGKSGSNNGAHKIETWHKVKKNYQLKKILSGPLAIGAMGALVTVDTPTGGVRVSKKHAANLIKQGLATPINDKGVIIDDLEVQW
jgi:hypothetical protein